MEYRTVPIGLLRVGKRLRPTDNDHVERLAGSIQALGLINPITVEEGKVGNPYNLQDGYWLVAGAHRLEACRSLGMTEIPVAVIAADQPALYNELLEIDENLAVSSLGRSDRARFVRRRKIVYEAMHPETQHGAIGNGRQKSRQLGDSTSDRFTADTAAATGRSERSVQRDVTRAERIAPDVLEAIAGTPFDRGRNLDALARMTVEQQRKIANYVQSGEMDSAKVAILTPLDEAKAIAKEERELVTAWFKARREARIRAAVTLDKRGELAKVGLKLTDLV